MKMYEALDLINKKEVSGYMVSFEKVDGVMLRSDHFPDKHAGEDLIPTEDEAWELARKLASKKKGIFVNFYVIDSDFVPVKGYEGKKILNR